MIEKLTLYQELVIKILELYAQVKPLGDIEVQTYNFYQIILIAK